MTWLEHVLHEHAHLDLNSAGDRAQMAEAIFGAIPKNLLVDSVASSARTILFRRGIPDAAGDLARELAASIVGAVLISLEIGR